MMAETELTVRYFVQISGMYCLVIKGIEIKVQQQIR
jgi:hypothetical protein